MASKVLVTYTVSLIPFRFLSDISQLDLEPALIVSVCFTFPSCGFF